MIMEGLLITTVLIRIDLLILTVLMIMLPLDFFHSFT